LGRRTCGGNLTSVRATARESSLDGSEEESKVEAHEIDVSDRKHDLAFEHHAFVEDMTEKIGELETLVAENVVAAHSGRSPTK
jgi:hypothetical protein